MRLESFLHDIAYERIESAVRPDFICKHGTFYFAQGVIIGISALFYSLMAFGGIDDRSLSCDDPEAAYSVEKSAQISFFTNLASIIVNCLLVPYFEMYGQLQDRASKSESESSGWGLTTFVKILEFTMRGAHFALGVWQLSILNSHSACFRDE